MCREPMQYEMTFAANLIRGEQPPKEMVINVMEWNYQYVTLDFQDYQAELVNESACQEHYLYLPDGWEVAPADKVTLGLVEQFSFSGAHFIILSDANVYLTKLGRAEKFKHAQSNTLWTEIEGRIVGGNDIVDDAAKLMSLGDCKAKCINDTLCKAVQYPRTLEGRDILCQMKSSTETNVLDKTYSLTTYIKLTADTAAGIPLRGNPDGLFARYFEQDHGLKVPTAYCPGRILLRKKRIVHQCADNGHWYELVHWDRVTYDEAMGSRSLYWRGAKVMYLSVSVIRQQILLDFRSKTSFSDFVVSNDGTVLLQNFMFS